MHSVEEVNGNGDITINRLLPVMRTHDMAQWYIIIELEKSIIPEQFNAIIIDMQRKGIGSMLVRALEAEAKNPARDVRWQMARGGVYKITPL